MATIITVHRDRYTPEGSFAPGWRISLEIDGAPPARIPIADEYWFVQGRGWDPRGEGDGQCVHAAVDAIVRRRDAGSIAVVRWYRSIYGDGQVSRWLSEDVAREIYCSPASRTSAELIARYNAARAAIEAEWPDTAWGGGWTHRRGSGPESPAHLEGVHCLTGDRGLVHLTLTVYGYGIRCVADDWPRRSVAAFSDDAAGVVAFVRAAPDVCTFPPRTLPGELCVEG